MPEDISISLVGPDQRLALGAANRAQAAETALQPIITDLAGPKTLPAIAAALTAGTIQTVAGSIAAVGTVSASIANVNLVASASANVNLVGPSISSVNTVAADLALGAGSLIRQAPAAVAAFGTTTTQGVAAPVAADTVCNANTSYISQTAFSASGTLSQIQIYATAPCTVTLFTCTVNSSGTLATLVASQIVSLQAGLNTVSSFNPAVVAGQYLGVYQPAQTTGAKLTNSVSMASSGGFVFSAASAGPPSASWGVTGASGPNVQMNWTIETGMFATLRGATDGVGVINTTLGAKTAQGVLPAVVAPYTGVANTSYINDVPIAGVGTLSRVSFWATAAGSVTIFTCSIGSGKATLIASQTVNVAGAGLVEVTTFNPTVAAGQFIGLYSPAACLGYSAGGTGMFQFTGGLISAAGSTVYFAGTNSQLNVGWEVSTGALLDLAKAKAATQGFGVGLLAAADNTGIADATAVVSAARAANPTPNVPVGTYSVTSIPAYGEGFWGPGTIKVNGVVMALPAAPERGSRYLKMRGFLASQIYSGSALIINGDSISAGSGASTGVNSWASLLTRFANLGVALDEPVFIDFDPAESVEVGAVYTSHGFTLANPTTVTNGSNGPVGTSLMLQPGQSVSMTGAYERIDATYTGVSGGVLAFAYNGGSAYATINCAASGSDVLAAPGATGQTASGAYTITNTGSVAVEITSIMRFGVKVAGSPPRLYVCRFAHGGYKFTNYGAAQIASMIRIATAIAGGTNHFLITELSTNDAAAGLTYAAIKANATAYLNAWIAAGVPATNMLPMTMWRWTGYLGNATGAYEGSEAAIRESYRAAGIKRVIQMDAYDMVAEGLSVSSTDGHPSDVGHQVIFNMVVEALCSGAL